MYVMFSKMNEFLQNGVLSLDRDSKYTSTEIDMRILTMFDCFYSENACKTRNYRV